MLGKPTRTIRQRYARAARAATVALAAAATLATIACVSGALAAQARLSTRAVKPARIAHGKIGFRVKGIDPKAVSRAFVELRLSKHRVRKWGVAGVLVAKAIRHRSTLWVFAWRLLKRGRMSARAYERRLRGARLVVVLRPPRRLIVSSPACISAGVLFRVGFWPPACWRPYADGSPFNQPLPANPRVYSNSAAVVTRTLSFGAVKPLRAGLADTTSDYYHPSYYSRPTDPVYTVRCTDYNTRCSISGMQVRIPAAARAAAGSDGHMAVIDQASGWEYDFWQVQNKPPAGGVIDISWGGRTPLRGSGLGSGATAAHFGLQAGIIRAQEMQAGRINHALFMVVTCTSNVPVYPAAANASVCSDLTNAPATGMRFQLYYSDAEINAMAVPSWKKTILRALAHYGAFVGDTGGSGFGFQFESGSTYTSFGIPDPMVAFAVTQPGVTASGGMYDFNLATGVNWSRLRVIDPCVSERTC